MSKTYSAGIVTAYGAAKRAGYTGTYEDFCRQQAGYAESAAAVEQAKNTAVSAANTATAKAGEATTAATAAQTAKTQTEAAASQALTDIAAARSGAISAVQTEGVTQTSNATAQAQAAAQSANAASAKASEASASATSAGQSATNAAASATSAASSASAAQAVLESIPEEYSDLSEDVDKLKTDLADVTNHAVKSSEQLISDKRTVDKVPYKYRASQSGKSDRAYDCIVGGTVCFNQLIRNGDFSDGTTGFGASNGSISASNGVLTFTASSGSGNKNFASGFNNTALDAIVGHKYFYSFYVKISTTNIGSTFAYAPLTNNGIVFKALTANTDTNIVGIRACTKEGKARIYVYPWDTGPTATDGTETCSAHDFTLIDLTAMFGTEIADYIYQLEQSQASAGVALFRAMFSNEYYPYNAGELISVEGLSAHVMRDEGDNIIGSYPLDNSLTLRGMPKLMDGKIEFDGDAYEADGTVTRRYGIVDLGTLTWYAEANSRFRAPMNNITPLIRFLGSLICTEYNGVKINTVENIQDKDISVTNSQVLPLLRVKDSTKASLTGVEFKASLSGVYLVYELATPTTEEATPYTNPQVVSPYGTEEYVSTSICPVGHVTEYPDNLRAKLDGLPWDLSMIAPVETAYTATRNYTVGQLLIVDNVLYKVTANIANGGTITAGTNVVATTLSEVISALA